MCIRDRGVAKDEFTAAKWFRKGAEQGHAGAQYNLGVMYANGQGVPQSLSEALRWLRKAEANGIEQVADVIQAVLQMQREQQAAAAEAEAAAAAPIPIATTVHLCGLQAKPELNGQRGVVTDFDASSGRCSVQLEDGRGPYKIKPENLEMVTEKREKKKKKKKKK